jgi:type II secretory pathway pseudopilin PulG
MNSNRFISQKRRQGGYTIVELGIALTIIAVLIIAGLAGVTAVLDSTKSNDQIASGGQTIAKLQNKVSTSSTLQNLTTTEAIGLSLFPNSRVNAARTAVTGVFSGGSEFITTNPALIAGLGADIPANRAGMYVIHNIPRAVCSDVALALAPLADSAWVIATPATQAQIQTIPGTTRANNIIKTNGGAVSPVEVSTSCAAQALSSLQLLLRP